MPSITPLEREELVLLYQRFGTNSSVDTDTHGKVLSVYIELPADVRHERRRWLSTLNSGLRELQARHPGDRELDRVADEVAEDLRELPPEARGRSLAYIAGPGGRQWFHSTQMPTGTQFAWHTRPVLRPLVSIVDSAPVTGAVVLAQDKARLLTWQQGLLHEDRILQADLDTSDWRRFSAGAVATASHQTATHSDDYAARFEEQVDRFVRGLATEVADHARERRWELIMLSVGSPRLAEVLAGALPPAWRERLLPPGDANLIRAGASELADHITASVAGWNQRRQLSEVRSVLQTSRSRGAAAAGPEDSIALLLQHRVAHLYFAADLQLTGYQRADGTHNLYPPPEGPFVADEHLVEWLIGECLLSGAGLTPVTGEGAALLREVGGVAAQLRY